MYEDILITKCNQIGISLNQHQVNKFMQYKDLLLEWNQKMNLTAITDVEQIITKHFVDSLTCHKYITDGMKIVDVGTGAGFPGIPLKILFGNDIDITLLDCLNKRIRFLDEIIDKLNLSKINTIHIRVEDAGSKDSFREQFDLVVSRAVSKLTVLCEYCLPLVKVGGLMLSMKGNNIEGELSESEKIIIALGGKTDRVEHFILPDTDIQRSFVCIKKIEATPRNYPRKKKSNKMFHVKHFLNQIN